MIEKLKKNYFFAVIRGSSKKDAIEIARHSILGGIKNIEITFTTPNAIDVIRFLLDEYKSNKEVIIGAGSVMNVQLAKDAIEAGAKFLVSPHFSVEIKDLAQSKNVLYIPGCATPTEICIAMDAGCQMIKAFPGGVLGPRFIKDIHGPIPQVDIMPSGGVTINNLIEWKKAGACAVGIGGALVEKIETQGYKSIIEIAQTFIKKLDKN